MRGRTLYPLNKLKEVYPDLYESEKEKYSWRQSEMMFTIPYLDVLWNDVLMFSPINPEVVKNELAKIGIITNVFDNYIKIPITDLNPKSTVWFDYSQEYVEGLKEKSKDIRLFDFSNYQELTEIPEHAKRYLKEAAFQDPEKFLIYWGIPHVLTADNILIDKYIL